MSESETEIATIEVPINRDSLGQFVAGMSGNPGGRARGSKNRTTIIKQAIEECLTRDLAANLDAILDNVMQDAITGDKDMIKLLLVDVLKDVRRQEKDDAADKKIDHVHISITQYFGEATKPADVEQAIDAAFSEVKNP